MKTLLEKAREIRRVNGGKLKYTKEDFDIALAWAKREISATQYSKAIGQKTISGTFLYHAVKALQWGLENGFLKEKL